MIPTAAEDIPSIAPEGGVYLFSEEGQNMYAGRTKRRISVRVRNHFTGCDCPFAFLLAREATGRTEPAYTKEGSRKALLGDEDFEDAYEDAKRRIRKMRVRYVHEPDPVRQALLEIYVAIVSKAKYNDFDTH